MGHHLCPWWLGYLLDNPARRWVHPPDMLGRWVRPGMTVLDLGCCHGQFSLAMARMVGPEGRVIAVDLQAAMLAVLATRASKAGLADRVDIRQASARGLGVSEALDFALAFYVLHEVRDQAGVLRGLARALKPTGRLLVLEPIIHISHRHFEAELTLAEEAGLALLERPTARFSRAALLAPRATEDGGAD